MISRDSPTRTSVSVRGRDVTPGLQIVWENLRISQTRQKSYAIVPFFGLMQHPPGDSSSDAWVVLSK